METALTVAPSLSPERLEGEEQKELAVLAKCIIKIGYVCTVYYPSHHDAESYRDHRMYHEQNARVVRIHKKGGLDLEMTTGPAKGSISENVDPTNLFFWGPFSSSTGVG